MWPGLNSPKESPACQINDSVRQGVCMCVCVVYNKILFRGQITLCFIYILYKV